MPIDDIVGHPTEPGEGQLQRGDIGSITDITVSQNNTEELGSKPQPKPTLLIAL